MLTTQKSITLTGHSEVENIQAVYFTANISDGESRISQAVQDQAKYDANKKDCRKDFQDFCSAVYAIEDETTPEDGLNE